MRGMMVLLACALLGGCSSAVYDLPAVYAPEATAAIAGAKKASNELSLVGPVEFSAVRESSYGLGPGPHMLCIKGTNSRGAQTYAAFFNKGVYIAARTSLIVDQCEIQPFTLLGNGPFAPPAAKGSSSIAGSRPG